MTRRQTMTAGQIRIALRRFVRDRATQSRRFPDDRVLAELDAARWIASKLELIVGELVAYARREDGPRSRPRSWRRIGEAMGVTGQAAGKWARRHQLPIVPIDTAQAVRQGRALTALSKRTRAPTVDPTSD